MTKRLLKSNVVNEQPVVLMELNFPGLNELSTKDVASYNCRINTSFEKPEKKKKCQKIEEGQILFCFQRQYKAAAGEGGSLRIIGELNKV